jgi:hypothetical protein
MTLRSRAALLLIAFGLIPGATHAAPPPKRTVSPSQQFIIYCDNLDLRVRLSDAAETTSATLAKLIETPGRWRIPIVVTVLPAPPDGPGDSRCSTRFIDTEDGGKVAIDLFIGNRSENVQLQREFVRAVLIEYVLRNGDAQRVTPLLPLWLLDGLTERLRLRDLGADAGLFQTLLDSNNLPPVADIIGRTRDAGEPTARALDAACSYSLLQLLVDLPNSRSSFGRYVRSFGAKGGAPMDQFARHFPQVAETPTTLEKWWSLSIARLSASDRFRGWTLDDSQKRLEETLTFRFPPAKGESGEVKLTLSDWRLISKDKTRREALSSTEAELQDLSARAHPMLRPVVASYAELVTALIRNKTRRFQQRLDTAKKQHEEVLTLMSGVVDYMNWYEAAMVKTPSGTFRGYLKSAAEPEPKLPRNDPITRYIDAVVAQAQ